VSPRSTQEPEGHFSEDASMSRSLPFIPRPATPRPPGNLKTFLDTKDDLEQVGTSPCFWGHNLVSTISTSPRAGPARWGGGPSIRAWLPWGPAVGETCVPMSLSECGRQGAGLWNWLPPLENRAAYRVRPLRLSPEVAAAQWILLLTLGVLPAQLGATVCPEAKSS
jgi:hypothetical protein